MLGRRVCSRFLTVGASGTFRAARLSVRETGRRPPSAVASIIRRMVNRSFGITRYACFEPALSFQARPSVAKCIDVQLAEHVNGRQRKPGPGQRRRDLVQRFAGPHADPRVGMLLKFLQRRDGQTLFSTPRRPRSSNRSSARNPSSSSRGSASAFCYLPASSIPPKTSYFCDHLRTWIRKKPPTL